MYDYESCKIFKFNFAALLFLLLLLVLFFSSVVLIEGVKLSVFSVILIMCSSTTASLLDSNCFKMASHS